MEGKHSSPYRRPTPSSTGTPQPRVVNEFEIVQRGIALRMRIERWPAKPEAADDEAPAEAPAEAGYGHGV